MLAGDAGDQAGQHRGAVPAGHRLGVGLRALGADGVGVEQVAGVCGTRPTCRTLVRRQPGRTSAADADQAGFRTPMPDQRPEQGRFAGAVAAHQRHDLAAGQLAGRHRSAHRPAYRDRPRLRPRGGRPGGGASGRPRQPGPERRPGDGRPGPTAAAGTSRPAGPARPPAARPGGPPVPRPGRRPRPAAAGHQHQPVGVLHDPLQPVLGHQDGDAEVVHQPVSSASTSSAADGSSAEVGSSSTSTRGCGGEHRADGHPLLLPGRQRHQRPGRWAAMPSTSSISSTRRRMTSGGTPSDSMP